MGIKAKRAMRRLILTTLFVVMTVLVSASPLSVSAAILPIYQYTKTFDTTNGYIYSNSVTTDSQNNVYVSGNFQGTIIFDGAGGNDSQTSPNGNASSFLTRYNSNGSYAWTRINDSLNGNSSSIFITTDTAGNIYSVGNFTGTVIFDGIGGSDTYTNNNGTNNPYITKYSSDGTYRWTNAIDITSNNNGSSGNNSNSIAVDNNGGVYIDGYFSGTATFDGAGGTHSVYALDHNSFLTKYNSDGSYAWTKTADDTNGTTTNGGVYGGGVVIDKSGNIYTTGYFYNTVILDGVGGSDIRSSAMSDNSFLTKYDHNGNYISTKTFDSQNGNARVRNIAIDKNDNIYLIGTFFNTIIFDGIGGTDSKTNSSNTDFITKFNADGSYGWTEASDSSNGGLHVCGLAVDDSGDVYVTGDFYGTVIFDGSGNNATTGMNPTDNTFMTKYEPNGNYSWTKTFDTSNGWSYGNSIAIDNGGNIYQVGFFNGTVVFDGVGGTDSFTSPVNGESYFMSYRTKPITQPLRPTFSNQITPLITTVKPVTKSFNTATNQNLDENAETTASPPPIINNTNTKTRTSPVDNNPLKPSVNNTLLYGLIGVAGLGIVLFIANVIRRSLTPQ
jgi:hypothetical protein